MTAEKVQALNQSFVDGVISIQAYTAAIKAIPTEVNTAITTSGAGIPTGPIQAPAATHATGTDGWMTVPPGYPNDTYRVGLTSGERYNVSTPDQTPSGANNYFYGNTTLVLAGDGSDFMDQR